MRKATFKAGRLSRLFSCGAVGAAVVVTVGAAAPAAGSRARPDAVTDYVFGLNAVSVDSSSDAWAVGESQDVLHWNGTTWAKVRIPGVKVAELNAVDALSPTDVWAAGEAVGKSFAEERTLILHWNGASWTHALSPKSYDTSNVDPALTSISMDSATDGWAVGDVFRKANDAVTTLAWHWNGSTWQQVTVGSAFDFGGVTSFSPTNALAVGTDTTSSKLGVPATFQWNGSSWAVSDLPVPQGGSGSEVFGPLQLSADSTTDIWGVGAELTSAGVDKALAWHWNGTSWTVMNMGLTTPETTGPQAVAAISPSDVWAVGYTLGHNRKDATWSAHWNGTSWTLVPTPDPNVRNVLLGVGAAGSSNVWAVGDFALSGSGFAHTLILRWTGTSWVQS